MSESLTVRPWAGEADVWPARAFLRAAFLAVGRRATTWHVGRFDYLRARLRPNGPGERLEDLVLVAEAAGEVVALALAEGALGEVHLVVHPAWRTPEREEALLDAAEARLARAGDDGDRTLTVWAAAEDASRLGLLRRRGYLPQDVRERVFRRSLDASLAVPTPAPGYTVRSLGAGLELLERCYASGLAFHDGDLRIAAENRDDPSWYRCVQEAPTYRRDLDLVAVAPDGAVAAFATVWFDDVTRSVLFEPVATVPAHRRRGLGRALLAEGMRRARVLGADVALVSGYGGAADALYTAGFGETHDDVEAWQRRW